jgi:hypothetical protein
MTGLVQSLDGKETPLKTLTVSETRQDSYLILYSRDDIVVDTSMMTFWAKFMGFLPSREWHHHQFFALFVGSSFFQKIVPMSITDAPSYPPCYTLNE